MSDIVREHLLQSLQIAKPAIAGQAFVPALTHFAFDGWGVTAYNDISAIGIRGPLDMQLCLPAEMLMKTLNSMVAEKVLLQEFDDSTIVVSSGRSKIKMPFLPIDKFPFEFPIVEWDEGFVVTSDMLKGIEKCLVGVGTDPTHPAQMGITLEMDGNGCTLYSTDNHTISRYRSTAEIELPGEVPVVLPTFFCTQLLSLSKAFKTEEILVALLPGAICASFGGQATLFTKLLVDLEPMDFSRILDKFLKGQKEDFIDIPNGFEPALDRALLVLASNMDKATKMTADGKSLKLFSSSQAGESTDTLAFDHPAIDPFLADPALVLRASKICRKITLMPKVMVLGDTSFTHMIAHCSK